MADLKNIRILDLIPTSIRGDPTVQAAAAALDGELARVTADIKNTLLVSRIDELPEAVLDLLALQWHVDFYEPVGFSIDKKRALIKQSIAWHRKKGTPWAVEQVLSAAFDQSEVLEWFDYGGDPYRFKVRTTDTLKDDEAYQNLIRAIFTVKNTRSWLDESGGLEVLRKIQSPVTYGVAARFGSIQQIAPRIVIPSMALSPQYGMVMRQATCQTVRPRLPSPTVSQTLGVGMRTAKITKIFVRGD